MTFVRFQIMSWGNTWKWTDHYHPQTSIIIALSHLWNIDVILVFRPTCLFDELQSINPGIPKNHTIYSFTSNLFLITLILVDIPHSSLSDSLTLVDWVKTSLDIRLIYSWVWFYDLLHQFHKLDWFSSDWKLRLFKLETMQVVDS
jgi:hypothetical protein